MSRKNNEKSKNTYYFNIKIKNLRIKFTSDSNLIGHLKIGYLLNDKLTELIKTELSVTADGVKTASTLLSELKSLVVSHGKTLKYDTVISYNSYTYYTSTIGVDFVATSYKASAPSEYHFFYIDWVNCKFGFGDCHNPSTVDNINYNLGSQVPINGSKITIYI